MEDNKDVLTNQEPQNDVVTMTASEIAEYNKNHVSKEEYDKVVNEKNAVVKAVLEGTYEGQKGNEETYVDIDETTKYLYGNPDRQFKPTDYVSKVLALRKAVIHRDGEENDPFLPYGHDVKISDSDRASAKRFAEGLQYALDQSNGDDVLFMANLQAITKEALPKAMVEKLIKDGRLK